MRCVFIWLLFVQWAKARIIRGDPWIPDDPIADDVPDPSELMAEIHAPNSDVFFMHQLSRSFLRITKDILSLTPRSLEESNQRRDINSNLNTLKQLNPEDLTTLLSDQGIMIPETYAPNCDLVNPAYRTMDGSCNNLANPCWGKAEEPYKRWLPADFANGIDEPRAGFDGSPLPSPREVYLTVSSDFEPSARSTISYLNNLIVTWGQILSHDLLFTPTVKIKIWDGQKIVDKKLTCCNSTSLHPDCWPLYINHEDIYYPSGYCMEFVRSAAYAHRASGCFAPALGQRREQINQLTSFLDASVIYGSSESEMKKLREVGGRAARLLLSEFNHRSYLPRSNNSCKSWRESCDKRCHLSGEKRANEQPALAALHTLLARQHNRLVELLRHKGWNEETLFHVVRKIVGAQMQHITYNEFLPLILGRNLANYMGLSVPTKNYTYEPTINPTLYNSFVCAAFRFGHSMVSGKQKRRGRKLTGSPVLSQDFFSMDDFCDTSSDSVAKLLGGQSEQTCQGVDAIFTKELTNHLFAKRPEGPGLDLVSINIQRGRDHGIPSYNRWREACGLPKALDYEDLKKDIPEFIVDRLAVAYGPGRVDDIDLYIAGVSETPVNDGILGPTYTCIISNQFRNLKYGDRFYYENRNHPGSFTEDQLNEIRKTTLSSLICSNSDVEEMQAMAFQSESASNPKWPCQVILHKHEMNLQAW